MKKYIVGLLVAFPLIVNSQIKTGIEIGVLISGSKSQKEIIPSSAWSSFLNVGYNISKLSVSSGLGYSSYQCENKTVNYITDNLGNRLGKNELIGYYTSSYLLIPLCAEYELFKNKIITPILVVGIVQNIKVSNSYQTNNSRYLKNESIKSSDLFTNTFASVGFKANIGKKVEAIIKSKYQYNTSNVFYLKNESLSFNGLGFNIACNYIF